jgi:hypothetical protein
MVSEPITSPKTILPESPRYMEAGSQLNFKNPNSAAQILSERIEMIILLLYKEMTKIVMEDKIPIDEAKPSIISIILKALIIISIQIKVNKVFNQGVRETIFIWSPLLTRI